MQHHSDKHIAASASSLLKREAHTPPETVEQAVACVERILASHAASRTNLLSEEEINAVAWCLDYIGSEEVSVADDGSLQGRGVITFEKAFEACSLAVSADIEVKNVWDRTRREWACTMAVRRASGSAPAVRFCFTFHFASFGVSEDGSPIVLFDFTYERTVDAPAQLANFRKGAPVKATEYDITSNVQWGYLIVARCRVHFADGSFANL